MLFLGNAVIAFVIVIYQVQCRKTWKDACKSAGHDYSNLRIRGPLIALLPCYKVQNIVEVKLLLQTCMSCRPAACPIVAAFVIQVMNCIAKNGVHLKFPKLVKTLKTTFDAALTWQVGEEFKAEQSNHSFVRKYGHLIDICWLDIKPSINELLAVKDTDLYSDHLEVLQTVSKAAKFLHNMFGWAVAPAMDGYLDKFCHSLCVWPESRLFSNKDLNSIVEKCVLEAERLDSSEVPQMIKYII